MAKTTKRKQTLEVDKDFIFLTESNVVARLEAESDNESTTYHRPIEQNITVDHPKKKEQALALKMYAWTAQNNWPQHVLNKLSESGLAKRALKVRMEDMYGKGLIPYTLDLTDKKRGFNFLTKNEAPDLFAFLKKTGYKRQLKKLLRNVAYFEMRCTEFIVDGKFESIDSFNVLDMDCVRFAYDEKMPGNKYVIYSREFTNGKHGNLTTVDKSKIQTIPVLPEKYMFDVELAKQWVKQNNISKFCTHSLVDSLGRDVYQDADWHAIIRNGTIDMPGKISKFKVSAMDNQHSPKYSVLVAKEYWVQKYGDQWETLEPSERTKIKEDWLQAFDETLAGTSNAFKSIMIPSIVGDGGELYRYIKIEEIAGAKSGTNLFIADLDSVNNEILKAIGVNPAKIGHGAVGSQMGAGSGSDIREANTVDVNSHAMNHDTIVEDFEFVRDFNGYDENIEFGFPTMELTTLDKNPTGSQTTM